MEKEKIPVKNYVVLAIIIITTVFITFHLAKSYNYNIEKDYYREISPLYEVLYKIKIEELDNYLLENPNIIIYVVDGNNKDTLKTDETIKKIVLEKDLTNEIIVIDITHRSDVDMAKFSNLLEENLATYKTNLFEQANLFVIKERKIIDLLTPKTKDEETIVHFFLKNDVM